MDLFAILRVVFFLGVFLIVLGIVGLLLRKPHALHTMGLGIAVALITVFIDMAQWGQ